MSCRDVPCFQHDVDMLMFPKILCVNKKKKRTFPGQVPIVPHGLLDSWIVKFVSLLQLVVVKFVSLLQLVGIN